MRIRLGVPLAVVLLSLSVQDCSSAVPAPTGCATGQLVCGGFCCPDDTHYACAQGQCTLIGCDQGYILCGRGCIPLTANCCSTLTGLYCQTGDVCCGTGCIPIGTSCCANGTFCPVGRVCCNTNQCC